MSDLAKSTMRLGTHDIANGNGLCTATLSSGVQLAGRVNTKLSNQDVLHLETDLGWHVIDWQEVAAISGEPSV